MLNRKFRLLVCSFAILTFFSVNLTILSAQPRSKKSVKKTKVVETSRKSKAKEKKPTSFPAPTIEPEGDIEKRDDWFNFERNFPKGEIPPDARRKAWEKRPPEAKSNNFAAIPQWTTIGPSPTDSFFPNNWATTSGRINAIAVSPNNPQLVLIGAATGGVWRSTNGGTSFVPVTDNQVDLAVGSIAFSASNPSIVYAGMGDKAAGYLGTGILKSTDGGQTWSRVNNTSFPSLGRTSKILVDPNNANRVYVAQFSRQAGNSTFSSGFFFSNDGGVNWSRTFVGLVRDVVFHPNQPNILYLGVQRNDDGSGSTGGVFKSTDSGKSWTRVYTSPYPTTSNIKVAVTPASPDSVYVLLGTTTAPANARVEISVNGGQTWTNKASGFDIGQMSYNFYLYVHPTDANTIFVGTRDLWRSTDGGTTYSNITGSFTVSGNYTPTLSKAHPDQHDFWISPSSPSTFYIANDGGLWKTDNNGSTFQNLNASLSLTMFVSLALHPTDVARSYGGTQDNGTQKRTSGMVWKEFSSGDGGQTVIDALDPSIVYTTYIEHSISRHANNGDGTRTQIGNTATLTADRVAFYPPFEGNGVDSTLYFGTYRLFVSTDRGASWTAPGGTTDLTVGGTDVLGAIGVGKSNPNIIYTGSRQGRLMISTNGGASWNDRTTGLPTRTIKSIVVNPTDSTVAYVTLSGFDSGHVFKTTNGGANWTDISSNLPNIPVNHLLIDSRNPTTLYVGTDIGVFRSTNDGGAWESYNQGMPPVIVTELVMQANGIIQASTYGRGAYQLNPAVARQRFTDFDGDGKTDVSVFRPSDGVWYIITSSNNSFRANQFGTNGDVPVSGDFDGDGKTDLTVFRQGTWHIFNSADNSYKVSQFGLTTDVPVAADYDGDGKTDLAVVRGNEWYVLRSSNGATTGVVFGLAGDIPTPGDFDGDGKTDLAVFRGGTWYVLKSSDGGLSGGSFGAAGDLPAQADFDGDGKTDYGVFRPAEGTWYVLKSTGGVLIQRFGLNGDIPVRGDYDGDGKADLAVFRPTDGSWYISNSSNGNFQGVVFGRSGDIPIPNKQNP